MTKKKSVDLGFAELSKEPIDQFNMVVNEAVVSRVLKVVDAGLVNGLGEPVPGKMCVEAAVNFALNGDHNDEPECVLSNLRTYKIDLNDSGPWATDLSRAKGMRRLAIAQLGTNTAKYTLKWADFKHQFEQLVDKKYGNCFSPLAAVDYRSSVQDVEAEVAAFEKKALASIADAIKDVRATIAASRKEAKNDPTGALETLAQNLPYELSETIDLGREAYLTNLVVNNYENDDVFITYGNFVDIPTDADYACEFALAYATHILKDEDKQEQVFADICELAVQALVKCKTPGSKFLYLTEPGGKTKAKKLLATKRKKAKKKK